MRCKPAAKGGFAPYCWEISRLAGIRADKAADVSGARYSMTGEYLTFWNVNLATPITGNTPPTIFGAQLRINTVFIPSELASSGYSRAWSLRTVLPLTKRVPEAGDRGKYLTVYEIQTDDIAGALARRASASQMRSRLPLTPLRSA